MITPNEHALELAARTLREKNLKRGGESIEIFRGFRKVEEHRLRMWHHAGAGGREVARGRWLSAREAADTRQRPMSGVWSDRPWNAQVRSPNAWVWSKSTHLSRGPVKM